MLRLILIRHGQTDYSLRHRYCGFSNPALNKHGVWQSKRLAGRFASLKVERVYSSDLKRAVETAKIIFNSNSIEKTENFREMNFGIFEGLRYEEIQQKYPKLYRDWIDNPLKVRIPSGESLRDLSKRVKERLSFILNRYTGGTIAVVAHSGPIRVILNGILNYRLKDFWQIKQDIAACNIIEYCEKLKPQIVKINDTSHFSLKVESAL